jgi:hypothetical protein
MTYFISCAACACPTRSNELSCPHCGATSMATAATVVGTGIPRTAAAVLLGLTAAVGSACWSAPVYGVGATGPVGGDGSTGGAEVGGAGGNDEGGAPAGGAPAGGAPAGGAPEGGAGGEALGGAAGQGGGAAPFYGIAGTGGSGGGQP